MNKVFGISGLAFIYLAITLLVGVTSSNQTNYTVFVKDMFATVTYDTQSQTEWYNENVPEAVVNSTPNPPLPPLPPTPPVRHSH